LPYRADGLEEVELGAQRFEPLQIPAVDDERFECLPIIVIGRLRCRALHCALLVLDRRAVDEGDDLGGETR
jgi:hypothetical protein